MKYMRALIIRILFRAGQMQQSRAGRRGWVSVLDDFKGRAANIHARPDVGKLYGA